MCIVLYNNDTFFNLWLFPPRLSFNSTAHVVYWHIKKTINIIIIIIISDFPHMHLLVEAEFDERQ